MNIEADIRDKPYISSEDITGLNFIKDSGTYVFRKHYREGLRSRIIEVLDANDFRKEKTGQIIDGIRWFPRAKPLRMLRLFVNRFQYLEDALKEASMFKIIEKYLGADLVAVSNEFIVDYTGPGRREIMLCGIQEYVQGEILDPWCFLHEKHLAELLDRQRDEHVQDRQRPLGERVQKAYESVDNLVARLKQMILEGGCIPDLSGVGNLILTPAGNIKLVDINNISPVEFGDEISVDDKGYPVCDKSVEVISILEQKLLQRPIDMTETIYGTFLDPRRMKRIKAVEKKYRSQRKSGE